MGLALWAQSMQLRLKSPLSIEVLFSSCSLFCHCCFWECTSKLTKLSSLLQLQKFTSLCAVCSLYLAASGREALSCLLLAVFVSQGYLFSAPSSFPLSASPLLFLLSASAIASSPLPIVISSSRNCFTVHAKKRDGQTDIAYYYIP